MYNFKVKIMFDVFDCMWTYIVINTKNTKNINDINNNVEKLFYFTENMTIKNVIGFDENNIPISTNEYLSFDEIFKYL